MSAAAEPSPRPAFATIEEAIEELRDGHVVAVVDDLADESQGDLVVAAQFATPEVINFMATHGRGLIGLCLTRQRCDDLGLELTPSRGKTSRRTAFAASVEAREGMTTGISAADRARTVRIAVDQASGPGDLLQPGHVFLVLAHDGGVLERGGLAEASIDLARLAGAAPAAAACGVLNEDGSTARLPDLVGLCRRRGIKLVTVSDLVEHRRRTEKLVERGPSVQLPTRHGDFLAVAFREVATGKEHIALVHGEVSGRPDVLVRVHSECLTGDVFRSRRCDCGEQLDLALARIVTEGRGVVLYLCQEGRGIGLLNKLRAYALQERGLDTVEANLRLGFPDDMREYGIGAQILTDLGLTTIRILTNNPRKVYGIAGPGLSVTEQVPLEVVPRSENLRYLVAKRDKFGHRLRHANLDG